MPNFETPVLDTLHSVTSTEDDRANARAYVARRVASADRALVLAALGLDALDGPHAPPRA